MKKRILTLMVVFLGFLTLGVPVLAQEPGPGETSGADLSPLLVTGFEHTTGEMTLSYQSGCDSTDNNVYFGLLGDVASQSWSGEQCGIGTGGQLSGFNPGSDSYLFIVAGNEDSIEGSYGLQRDKVCHRRKSPSRTWPY